MAWADTGRSAEEFEALVERRLDRAYALAGYVMGNATDAEDAVQDALVRAWRSWSSLRELSAFDAWFDRIVVNVCRTRLSRRHTRNDQVLGGEEPEARDPFRTVLASDAVGAALELLPADHRVVVVLRFWADMTLEDIAERLGVPVGTVKSRLHYALRRLAKEVER